MAIVRFKYRNHHGKVSDRTVDVQQIEWIERPGFDYQPGWFISGICQTKQAHRSFALSHVVLQKNNLKLVVVEDLKVLQQIQGVLHSWNFGPSTPELDRKTLEHLVTISAGD